MYMCVCDYVQARLLVCVCVSYALRGGGGGLVDVLATVFAV